MNRPLVKTYVEQRFRFLRSGLHRKFILHLLAGAVIGILLYAILMLLSMRVLSSWHPFPYLVKEHSLSLRNSLSDFTRFENLSSEDVWRIQHWIDDEEYVKVHVVANGDVLFSSFENPMERFSTRYRAIDLIENRERRVTLQLQDTQAEAIVYYLYQEQAIEQVKPIIFIVVSLFYILFASFYIRHQSRRIRTITQLIASFSDYNYQRRFEYRGYDELSLLAATLEQYRLDRIATIAESERSEEENRELIRNIAHDLRTPLTALIGYLEIMQKDEAELPDQHVAYLDSAKTKAEQLRTISNDVFEHFLIKSDQIKGMLVLMNGQLFMAQIADLMETDLEALGFTLQTDLTPEPYMLRINTEMFDRILNNLLNNIARYGDRDTPCQLSTSLLTTESADDRSVQTTGQEASYLSVMLSNAKGIQAPLRGSAGIGLANVNRIMEAHSGHLRVSQTRKHFTVRLIFPLASSSESQV